MRVFDSLVDALRWRAEHQTDRLAYRFLTDGDLRSVGVTYGELDYRSCAIAALLQATQVRGDRTLLVYPPGLDFITAFFGCLYAGAVAVIVSPPSPARLAQFLSRTSGVSRDATPVTALTTTAITQQLAGSFDSEPDLHRIRWMATDGTTGWPGNGYWPQTPGAEDLAFLQYTSGSTTEPRGVMVSHGNLAANLRAIDASFAQPADTESVCWLPPQHDMGLIGGILAPMYLGTPATLLPALSFIQRPWRWLHAISRFRATVSGGPNFAYDLCLRRVTPEQRADLDLSSWEVAFTGAEPISVETLQNFTATYAASGFRPDAFKPCYGLAEATLMVSASSSRTPPRWRRFQPVEFGHNRAVPCSANGPGGQALPSCGRPITRLAIVDPETLTECQPGVIGEIWVTGKGVGRGYWNRPQESETTFRARIKDREEEAFLRTGDLGFVLEGELYVTGRLKDLIIIDGTNHYPQDIERTVVHSHPALESSECAAFSVAVSGREELIVVAATGQRSAPPVAEIRRAIRTAVTKGHDLRLHDFVLLRSGHIPKTASGKIRRNACRREYLAQTIDAWGE